MNPVFFALGTLILAGLAAYLWWNRSVIHIGAANRAWRRGDEPGTLAGFLRAEAAGRLGAEPVATLAYLLLKAGRTAEAGSLLDKNLNPGPRGRPLKQADLRLLETYRSLVLWKNGDTAGAAGLLEDLLAQGYRTVTLYGNLGFFLLELGRLDRAEALCLEAVGWDPEGKVLLDNLASVYLARELWTKAAETYRKLLDLGPRFPEAWHGAGLAALRTGDAAEARRCWERALELPFHSLTTVERAAVEKDLAALAQGGADASQ